jgi:hypothetical protein
VSDDYSQIHFCVNFFGGELSGKVNLADYCLNGKSAGELREELYERLVKPLHGRERYPHWGLPKLKDIRLRVHVLEAHATTLRDVEFVVEGLDLRGISRIELLYCNFHGQILLPTHPETSLVIGRDHDENYPVSHAPNIVFTQETPAHVGDLGLFGNVNPHDYIVNQRLLSYALHHGEEQGYE